MKRNKNNWFNYLTENTFSVRVIVFAVITLTAIIVRLNLSFSTDLIAGMDGGYYPLQVRKVLNTGVLGFNDVPLYFYFCALVLKIISLFGVALSNETIISVVKTIDSIALPLLAIPLFKITSSKDRSIPIIAAIAILLFSLFSFSPFAMLGDVQKNAFAIPFLFLFIYLAERYLIRQEKRILLWALLTLFVITLTHFGVFTFAITFLIVLLFVVYKKKAIIPTVLIILFGFGVISIFDSNRAFRLITFWNEIFNKRFIFHEPLFLPILTNTAFSYFLAIFGIIQHQKFKNEIDKATKYILVTLIVIIFIFAFPLYESNYVMRFNGLLFVPQSLLIVYLIRINKKLVVSFSTVLVVLTVLFSFMYFSQKRQPSIDMFAYKDLQNFQKYIPKNTDSTIIIARHGLEFWTAWALNIKVGNERTLDKLALDKYESVIFLFEKNSFERKPMGNHPFPKSRIPKECKLIYSSHYFNAYEKKKLKRL